MVNERGRNHSRSRTITKWPSNCRGEEKQSVQIQLPSGKLEFMHTETSKFRVDLCIEWYWLRGFSVRFMRKITAQLPFQLFISLRERGMKAGKIKIDRGMRDCRLREKVFRPHHQDSCRPQISDENRLGCRTTLGMWSSLTYFHWLCSCLSG